MEASIYTVEGKKKGTIELPERIFGVAWNDSLMHQVVTSMEDNARTPVAHTKNRGDVSGGGKKPWKQKGTGRARHGSIRSPIWVGGGVTHGPRNEKKYARAIPKKMRAKALYMALSKKLADGEIVFVDSLHMDTPKTALAAKTLGALAKAGAEHIATKRKNAALIALANPNQATKKSWSNIGSVLCADVRNLNPVTVLKHAYIVLDNPEAAVAILANRTAPKKNA